MEANSLSIKFGTIFGAGVGFEIVSKADFDSINFPANWSLIINLLFVRVAITSYVNE